MRLFIVLLIFSFSCNAAELQKNSQQIAISITKYQGHICRSNMVPFIVRFENIHKRLTLKEINHSLYFKSTTDTGEEIDIPYKLIFVKEENDALIYSALIESHPDTLSTNISVTAYIEEQQTKSLLIDQNSCSIKFRIDKDARFFGRELILGLINDHQFEYANAVLTRLYDLSGKNSFWRTDNVFYSALMLKVYFISSKFGIKDAIEEINYLKGKKWGLFHKQEIKEHYSENLIFINELEGLLDKQLSAKGNYKVNYFLWCELMKEASLSTHRQIQKQKKHK